MWVQCYYRNRLSEADVIVGGRCHMLCVKEHHSHATLSRNDVKIALLPPCQSCIRGWKYVTLWRKRDLDYLMIRPLRFTNRNVGYDAFQILFLWLVFWSIFINYSIAHAEKLVEVCMETSWLCERKLPLTADELGQAVRQRTCCQNF